MFVGNDTGPKHLASVRGVPVVSIHMGAVNWREWGQEFGFIVTRRTPCYGCGIEHIEDCGKGLPCLVNITVEDVFGAVEQALMSTQEPASQPSGMVLRGILAVLLLKFDRRLETGRSRSLPAAISSAKQKYVGRRVFAGPTTAVEFGYSNVLPPYTKDRRSNARNASGLRF